VKSTTTKMISLVSIYTCGYLILRLYKSWSEWTKFTSEKLIHKGEHLNLFSEVGQFGCPPQEKSA